MTVLEKINIGIIGTGNRSCAFLKAIKMHNNARIHAVCDNDIIKLSQNKEIPENAERYTDYEELLSKSKLDAVIIVTPIGLHAEQAILAIQKGIHVLSEVTAGASVEQCHRLVTACQQSDAIYMFAENMTYTPYCIVITELVKRGMVGTPYYGVGEYLHSVHELAESTTWRLPLLKTNGITYGTHSIGPILQWMNGERVEKVCCQGSGVHHEDSNGKKLAQDTPVMLCKTNNGSLIQILTDFLSPHPFAHNYILQGTEGCCEVSFGEKGMVSGRICTSKMSREHRWLDIDTLLSMDSFVDTYLPDFRSKTSVSENGTHWGGDYRMVGDFLEVITRNRSCTLGIHEAMDMTLPGLYSQKSIIQGGIWLDVPNSRKW